MHFLCAQFIGCFVLRLAAAHKWKCAVLTFAETWLLFRTLSPKYLWDCREWSQKWKREIFFSTRWLYGVLQHPVHKYLVSWGMDKRINFCFFTHLQ